MRPLGETDITVKTGETFEIAFTSTKDINIEKDSYFRTPGGTEIYLTVCIKCDIIHIPNHTFPPPRLGITHHLVGVK